MTNQQGVPEALRLADALECRTTSWPDKVFAAAELRRLHAENEALRTQQQECGNTPYDEGPFALEQPAPATQQAGEVSASIEQLAVARYKVVPAHESMFHRWAVVAGDGAQQLYIGREVECEDMTRKFAGAFLDGAFLALQNATPQQPAKAESLRQILTDPENQPNQYGVEFGMSGQQMHFKIGNQLFRLAYEPDDQQEFEFMKRMLIHAFSTFTPDVKMAQQPSPTAQAAESVPAHQRDTGYPPLPECDATTVGLGAVWNRHSMRAYADATHALRAQQPAPSAAAAGNALPEGWVPLVITHEGQYPEEVAYGPQILMGRLGKWLRKYFDHVVASKAQPSPTAQAAESVLEDAARLDWLDQQCEAYGFQDIHEGNRWEIGGPYANVRDAIDAERAARKQGGA